MYTMSTWHGRDTRELSKEELVEALTAVGMENEELRKTVMLLRRDRIADIVRLHDAILPPLQAKNLENMNGWING